MHAWQLRKTERETIAETGTKKYEEKKREILLEQARTGLGVSDLSAAVLKEEVERCNGVAVASEVVTE